MPLPNFLCVGAAKAGTTTLWRALKQHPDVFVPPQGEVHFFNTRQYTEKGIDWYKDLFAENYSGETAIGDVSPGYMSVRAAAGRIRETLGADVKLVFLLRNPAERAYSHYMREVAGGNEQIPFLEAIELEASEGRKTSYLKGGKYYSHISRFLEYFNFDNMKFIIFDDFTSSQKDKLKEIFRFINADDIELGKTIHANKGGTPRHEAFRFLFSDDNTYIVKMRELIARSNILQNTARKIFKKSYDRLDNDKIVDINESYFKKDIKKLEQLLDCDLKRWCQEK